MKTTEQKLRKAIFKLEKLIKLADSPEGETAMITTGLLMAIAEVKQELVSEKLKRLIVSAYK